MQTNNLVIQLFHFFQIVCCIMKYNNIELLLLTWYIFLIIKKYKQYKIKTAF